MQRRLSGVVGSLTITYYTFIAEWDGERVLEIGQHLAKLRARVSVSCYFIHEVHRGQTLGPILEHHMFAHRLT